MIILTAKFLDNAEFDVMLIFLKDLLITKMYFI